MNLTYIVVGFVLLHIFVWSYQEVTIQLSAGGGERNLFEGTPIEGLLDSLEGEEEEIPNPYSPAEFEYFIEVIRDAVERVASVGQGLLGAFFGIWTLDYDVLEVDFGSAGGIIPFLLRLIASVMAISIALNVTINRTIQ